MQLSILMKRSLGKGQEKARAEELLSPQNSEASSSWHVDVVTNQEISLSLVFIERNS